jgi:hypothetical protein
MSAKSFIKQVARESLKNMVGSFFAHANLLHAIPSEICATVLES